MSQVRPGEELWLGQEDSRFLLEEVLSATGSLGTAMKDRLEGVKIRFRESGMDGAFYFQQAFRIRLDPNYAVTIPSALRLSLEIDGERLRLIARGGSPGMPRIELKALGSMRTLLLEALDLDVRDERLKIEARGPSGRIRWLGEFAHDADGWDSDIHWWKSLKKTLGRIRSPEFEIDPPR